MPSAPIDVARYRSHELHHMTIPRVINAVRLGADDDYPVPEFDEAAWTAASLGEYP